MAAYVIANVKVTDDSWLPKYAEKVHDIIHRHGGMYLSRSANVETLEGEPLDTALVAIVQFPSVEAAKDFAADPEYVPLAKSRQAGSVTQAFVIDDTDAAGTVPYLLNG